MLSSAEIWGQRCTFFGYSRKSTIRDLKIFDHIKQIWKHLCTFIWYFCPLPPLPPVGFPPPFEQIHRTNKIASQNEKTVWNGALQIWFSKQNFDSAQKNIFIFIV